MAELAREQTGADQVWFMPAAVPPHKGRPYQDFAWRTEMVAALIDGRDGLLVCAIEQELPPPSYTVDTVAELRRRHPEHSFWFLIGADSLQTLPTWHGAERLAGDIPFLVAPRAGYPTEELFQRVSRQLPGLRLRAIDMPIVDVSSTWLRQRLLAGKSACGLIPERVVRVWQRADAPV